MGRRLMNAAVFKTLVASAALTGCYRSAAPIGSDCPYECATPESCLSGNGTVTGEGACDGEMVCCLTSESGGSQDADRSSHERSEWYGLLDIQLDEVLFVNSDIYALRGHSKETGAGTGPWIAVINQSGEFQWQKRLSNPDNATMEAVSMAADSEGFLYVLGSIGAVPFLAVFDTANGQLLKSARLVTGPSLKGSEIELQHIVVSGSQRFAAVGVDRETERMVAMVFDQELRIQWAEQLLHYGSSVGKPVVSPVGEMVIFSYGAWDGVYTGPDFTSAGLLKLNAEGRPVWRIGYPTSEPDDNGGDFPTFENCGYGPPDLVPVMPNAAQGFVTVESSYLGWMGDCIFSMTYGARLRNFDGQYMATLNQVNFWPTFSASSGPQGSLYVGHSGWDDSDPIFDISAIDSRFEASENWTLRLQSDDVVGLFAANSRDVEPRGLVIGGRRVLGNGMAKDFLAGLYLRPRKYDTCLLAERGEDGGRVDCGDVQEPAAVPNPETQILRLELEWEKSVLQIEEAHVELELSCELPPFQS